MTPTDLQQQLINLILEGFAKRSQAVTELSKLLDVSVDSVYRRLRGDTILNPEEISLLARKFEISLDNLIFQREQHLLFSFNAFERQILDFGTYIDQLFQTAQGISRLPEVEMYFAVQDLPIFMLPVFPRLFSFRLYVYGQSYWKFDQLKDSNFHFDLLPEPVMEKAIEVNQIYNSVTSHELWNLGLIDNMLNQIEYLATVDRFENLEQIKILCQDLMDVVTYLKMMAKSGHKFYYHDGPEAKQATFDLYYNEFAGTNDSILISSPDQKVLFTSFGSPDFLSTRNQRFCEHLENWFKTIIARSTSISTHSERKRDWVFRHLEKKIRMTQEKIEVLYDY